jgi:Arc/MetJ-type ribon-helix-helix transcriptional regulator
VRSSLGEHGLWPEQRFTAVTSVRQEHATPCSRPSTTDTSVCYRVASHSGTICQVSAQIAVRLPEELVEFIDRLVADGRASSRAAVVSQALQRERRRELAARDAAILAAGGQDDDLDALAQHVAQTPLDDLD